MPISIPTVREKINTTNASPTLLTPDDPIEIDENDSIFLGIISAVPINPPSFTVELVSTADASVTITTTNSFENVKVGDIVSGAGINPLSVVTVLEKVSDINLRLSEAAILSSVSTITFTPPPIVPTYYGIEIRHSFQRDRIFLNEIKLYKYDGSLGGVDGNANNYSQVINLIPTPSSPADALVIDTEKFLTKLRIPKTA